MKNINELITETARKINFDVSARLADYCQSSDYICDAISEIVDSDCPCYYSGLLKWFNDTATSEDYVNDAVNEYGFERGEFDIFKAMSWGWCDWAREQIEHEKSDALYLAALCFVRDDLKLEEITNEQAEELENIDFDRIDTFIDLQNEIQAIFDL